MSHLNSKYGFICNKCSDKSLSYPNKFMLNFLDQIKCEYFSEASKLLEGLEWLNGYRYDFLAITQNGKYFIEMDGHFHKYNNTLNGTTVEEQQAIDRYKDNLAKQYSYQVIRIDCCYKSNEDRHTFIKHNIINSEVMNIFNISEDDINWDECDKYALSNTLHIICDYWNAGNHDVMDIVKQFRLSLSCIHFNLLKGAELGLCDYDTELSKKEKIKKEKEQRGMPCVVLKDGIVVGVFETGRELARQSLEKFGHYFNPGHISYVCTGRVKTCFGYNIQRITREKYEEILTTIQN